MELQKILQSGSDSLVTNIVCYYYEDTEKGQDILKKDEFITRTLLDECSVSYQRNHFGKVNAFPMFDYLYASEEPSEDEQKEAEEAPPMPQPPIPSKGPSEDKKKEHTEDEQKEAEEAPTMPRSPTP